MKQHGITLIELMVTMAILGIITAIAIPAYNGYIQTGRLAEANQVIAAIELAEAERSLQSNTYFQTIGGAVTTAANVATASGGLFVAPVAGTQWFDFGIAACGTGTILTCYTITAQGKGDMTGQNISKSGP